MPPREYTVLRTAASGGEARRHRRPQEGTPALGAQTLRRVLASALLALVAVLTACAQPLPADRADYAGDWRGKGVSLLISPDGQVVYHRRDGDSSVSVDAPLKAFDGDDFEVGIGPLVTRFDVGQPPTEKDGEWTMEVDGRMLRREDSRAPKTQGGIDA